MSFWATRRKFLYSLIFVIPAIIGVGIAIAVILHEDPTCTDGVQNGDEAGIDCGGSCPLLCLSQVSPPIVHWARAFKVAPGIYDAVAFLENPNTIAAVREILYNIKIYDSQNILIAEKFGKTFLLPSEQFAVFEGRIETGAREPRRVFFEIVGTPLWIPFNPDSIPRLNIINETISNADSAPRLRAALVNKNIFEIRNIEISALIYDANGNAIGASATDVPIIHANEEVNLTFTWPEPFPGTPTRIDIIPRVNVFSINVPS
ncbi:hypothetical protein L0Y49_04720 [bacterium]|nr:hypothetical protein [bacterium]